MGLVASVVHQEWLSRKRLREKQKDRRGRGGKLLAAKRAGLEGTGCSGPEQDPFLSLAPGAASAAWGRKLTAPTLLLVPHHHCLAVRKPLRTPAGGWLS